MFPETFWVSFIYKENFIYKTEKKSREGKEFRRSDKIIKLVKKFEEV